MSDTIEKIPLTAEAFAPFGDVIELRDEPDSMINQGMCARHHDLAKLDFVGDGGGRPNISLGDSRAYHLPLKLDMVERHPLGSQAFVPLSDAPFLIVVAPDEGGRSGTPRAFISNGRQGVNYHRGTWHGVLTPLGEAQVFLIVDRTGEGDNLVEHHFEAPYTVV